MDIHGAINTIGYFLLHRLKRQCGYIGAMLILDNEGIPREFKCTEAIKPSPAQQSLYGEKMEMYIAIKLCAIPLLDAVKNKPEILFVNEQSFLTIREETEIPTLFVQRTDNDTEQSAIVLMSHSEHEYDRDEESIRQSCRFDLVEPFERIKNAVAILGEKDERFR